VGLGKFFQSGDDTCRFDEGAIFLGAPVYHPGLAPRFRANSLWLRAQRSGSRGKSTGIRPARNGELTVSYDVGKPGPLCSRRLAPGLHRPSTPLHTLSTSVWEPLGALRGPAEAKEACSRRDGERSLCNKMNNQGRPAVPHVRLRFEIGSHDPGQSTNGGRRAAAFAGVSVLVRSVSRPTTAYDAPANQ